ncbi:unnamed protein product [Phytomonas sp. Hart1]|nr:unnamed protein product [Phytomonas sp. Hart1]|eukprot:CCW66566.1 unnamed protein product [Phytomonas sp. isolate Hart1]
MGIGNSNYFRPCNKVDVSNNIEHKISESSTSKSNSERKVKSSIKLGFSTSRSKRIRSSLKTTRATMLPSPDNGFKLSISSEYYTSRSELPSPEYLISTVHGNHHKPIRLGSMEKSKPDLQSLEGATLSAGLSRRAQNIVKRVEGILSRCKDSAKGAEVEHANPSEACTTLQSSLAYPSKDDIAMYEMFALLHSSRIGSFYAKHLELLLSNRSAVFTTPDFPLDWNTVGYQMGSVFTPGTIGRSYLAVKDFPSKDSSSILVKKNSRFSDRVRSRDTLKSIQDSRYVLKVVNFVLRKEIVDAVVLEQQFLKNTTCDNILAIFDVLCDEYKENVIIVSEFQPSGNVASYAGKLDSLPDKLLRIINDVALGLRFLNFSNIYHHNLKLENVLEMPNERYCIADAGFVSLFTSQCPEALVFNGELGCLAPEMFNEDGPYADDSVYMSSLSLGKVDTWGFGVFMYTLAYGNKPLSIVDCDYNAVKECLLTSVLSFPKKPWSFEADLIKVISLCLTRDAASRPDIEELFRMPFFINNNFSSGEQGTSPLIKGPSFSRFRSSAMLRGFSSMPSITHFYQKSGYTVDRVLGRGSFSETFLVHLRRNTSKYFALKAIQRSIHKIIQEDVNEAGRELILRQLATCKKITHPNLVQYLSIVDNKKGSCFVIQDYIEGETLTVMLSSTDAKPNSPNERNCLCIHICNDGLMDEGINKISFQKILADVLCGIVCLHDNGIPHLSLRPSNILYDVETKKFMLTDYGPLFFNLDENLKNRLQGKSFYHLPSWVLKSESDDPFMLDTFCVGLLAASIVPKVFTKVWPQIYCSEERPPLSVDGILNEISSDKSLPNDLISFIRDALCNRRTARQLLQHHYFEGKFETYLDKIQKVLVSSGDLSRAILSKPEERDEPRILEALGWVSFLSSPIPSALIDTGELSVSNDKPIIVSFTSSGLQCTLCHAKISLALYCCLQCEEYICCGKCAINDNHKPGHQLIPFIVNVIECKKDGSGCAVLCHPCSILDVHALETIEMQANFPVGVLSGMVNNTRSLERSLVHSMSFNPSSINGINISSQAMLDTSYATLLQDSADDSSSSVSVQASSHSKRFSSIFSADFQEILFQNSQSSPFSKPRSSFRESRIGSASLGKKTPATRLTSHVTPTTSEKSFVCAKNELKVVTLPKAQDVEDITWQEELERCRRTSQADLMLFNYGFAEVPAEVYTPPPLHVVYLDLSQNALTSLPKELSCMVHLRKLLVSYNKLTVLPDTIGHLTQLEQIDASHNVIEDLPSSFDSLVNLQSIAMDYNNFCEIPSSILRIHSAHSRSVPQPSSELIVSFAKTIPGNADSPALKVLYLAANDRITTWPEIDQFRRFDALTIALDNEPTLYRSYLTQELGSKLPNITINWNKIYPDEIVRHIYCGSLRSAQSQMVYRKLDISYVLTIGRGLMPVPPEGGRHKVIVVDDIPGADISYSFQEAAEFINESLKKGKGCLVHCFAGLSRSATIVIAYLMSEKKMRMDDAYMLTKKGRPAIFPNKSFLEQLIELDKRLYPNASRPLNIEQLERPIES